MSDGTQEQRAIRSIKAIEEKAAGGPILYRLDQIIRLLEVLTRQEHSQDRTLKNISSNTENKTHDPTSEVRFNVGYP